MKHEYTKYGRIYVICCQDDMRRSVPHSEAHGATAAARIYRIDLIFYTEAPCTVLDLVPVLVLYATDTIRIYVRK